VQENTAGKYTYNKSCASCWLHAASNGGTTDPCATAPSNGLYCGQSTQFGGGTKDVLYDCQNGATASKTTCAYGCIVEPQGTNDKCAPAPADAGSDASSQSDASPPASDAGATLDAAATQDSAPPPAQDAGNGGGTSTGGCSVTSTTASTTSTSTGALLAMAAFALARRRRRR